jgi:hypothetical protein
LHIPRYFPFLKPSKFNTLEFRLASNKNKYVVLDAVLFDIDNKSEAISLNEKKTTDFGSYIQGGHNEGDD